MLRGERGQGGTQGRSKGLTSAPVAVALACAGCTGWGSQPGGSRHVPGCRAPVLATWRLLQAAESVQPDVDTISSSRRGGCSATRDTLTDGQQQQELQLAAQAWSSRCSSSSRAALVQEAVLRCAPGSGSGSGCSCHKPGVAVLCSRQWQRVMACDVNSSSSQLVHSVRTWVAAVQLRAPAALHLAVSVALPSGSPLRLGSSSLAAQLLRLAADAAPQGVLAPAGWLACWLAGCRQQP